MLTVYNRRAADEIRERLEVLIQESRRNNEPHQHQVTRDSSDGSDRGAVQPRSAAEARVIN